MDKDNKQNLNNDSMVEANQAASDKNAQIGEAEIKTYEELNPDGKPKDDLAEIASTDDV